MLERTEQESCILEGNRILEQCYVELHAKLVWQARRAGLSPHVAEDLAQECWLKLLHSRPTIIKLAHKVIPAYIFRTMKHLVIDFWTEQNKKELLVQAVGAEMVVENYCEPCDALTMQRELQYRRWLTARSLAELVCKAGEEPYQILKLRYLEGKSYKEIASELDIPVAQLGSKLKRAAKKVRRFCSVPVCD